MNAGEQAPEDPGPGGASLAEVIPVFPLPGVLLLPRGTLPLNIFEPRYVQMLKDALDGPRLIGMIQPRDPDDSAFEPEIYDIGCVGMIASYMPGDEGTYFIALRGVCRFGVREELERGTLYRQVKADYSAFMEDLTPAIDGSLDRAGLVEKLERFFAARGAAPDKAELARLSDEELVSAAAMSCPFAPNERQALLMAPTLTARAELLDALLDIAIAEAVSAPGGAVQ